MREINRFTVAKTASQMYPREPFISITRQDFLKFNSAASEMLDLPAEGGGVVFLVDEETNEVFLKPSRKEGAFFLRRYKGGLSMNATGVARFLREHFKLAAEKPYRVSLRRMKDKEDKEMFLLLTPKLYRGNN